MCGVVWRVCTCSATICNQTIKDNIVTFLSFLSSPLPSPLLPHHPSDDVQLFCPRHDAWRLCNGGNARLPNAPPWNAKVSPLHLITWYAKMCFRKECLLCASQLVVFSASDFYLLFSLPLLHPYCSPLITVRMITVQSLTISFLGKCHYTKPRE